MCRTNEWVQRMRQIVRTKWDKNWVVVQTNEHSEMRQIVRAFRRDKNFRQCKGIFWWCWRIRHHLIKWLFGCSLMQASIRTNIHFISPIYDRLHQNSFSTESFFTEWLSQNYHSWNNPLYITARGSVLTQMPKADAGAIHVSRVKTEGQFGEHSKFDQREINPLKGSKKI